MLQVQLGGSFGSPAASALSVVKVKKPIENATVVTKQIIVILSMLRLFNKANITYSNLLLLFLVRFLELGTGGLLRTNYPVLGSNT